MAGCFTSQDANGNTLNHYFRLSDSGLPFDTNELMAQGREAEVARKRRDFNRLPCFDSVRDAKRAFEAGSIPGVYGSWCSWRYNVNADLDDFRQDHRVRRGLAA